MKQRSVTLVASILIAAGIFLPAGFANAQDAITVSFSGTWVDAETQTTYLYPGSKTITFTLNVVGNPIEGSSNGFRIYNQDGNGTFGAVDGAWSNAGAYATYYDGINRYVNKFSCDGTGADTIGFGGYTGGSNYIPVGTQTALWSITTSAAAGEVLCIDTAFYPPGGGWLWATSVGDEFPDWYDQPYCLEVRNPPPPPIVMNCPSVGMTFSHCVASTYDFNASISDGSPITYSMVSGKGTINATSGVWSYTPTLADVGPVFDVVVRAQSTSGSSNECSFAVAFTNQAPTITCLEPKTVGVGVPWSRTIGKNNVDCDNGTFSILGVTPVPVGPYSIHPTTGVLYYTAAEEDNGLLFQFTLQYTDGNLSDTCVQELTAADIYACCELRGDADGNHLGPNVSDLTRYVQVFFKGWAWFPCETEADANNDGHVNIGDMVYIVSYLFKNGAPIVPCP